MQTSSFIRNLLIVFAILSFSNNIHAQLSTKHFIPPLTSGPNNANPQDQWIYISTSNNSQVPYTVTPVGNPANEINGTVSNTTPQVESIGNGYDTQLFVNSDESSLVKNNKGYIIEAEAPIYVSVRMNAGGAQAGALVSKGISALDTTFRIGTYTNEDIGNPSGFDNYLSFVSVMATEDATTVNFNDLPSGLTIENYTGSIPITITLNEGESYTIALKSDQNLPNLTDGLIGALVTSDKPIAINCGSTNGSFHNGGARDYGIDQIAGITKIGNEYIFVKGDGNNDWENVLVVAHTDNTSISINGNAPIATINSGDYYVIEGNNYSANNNMYVETSEDVFMYQGVGSSSEANQGMFFVPPLSCETRGNIDNIANIDRIGNLVYSGGVTIVTRQGANVTINNQALSNFSSVGPSFVTGNSDYVTYRITGLTGNVSVQGDDELYVAYFNVNGAATSGSFYSGFQSKPEVIFDTQFTALGNCIGNNLILEVSNAQNFESFEWLFDDGSGFSVLSGETNATLQPTLPGKYKIIGELPCNGGSLESIEIPVSICPDDIDNDGIIDNIDIDNDNDGILNCTESRGDVRIDISNETNPILNFINPPANPNTIVDNVTTSPNANIDGDANGNFTSVINSSSSTQENYNFTFNEVVNIKLTEHENIINTSTTGEIFVVRILPSTKNITLVDPDNRLLVDSNFDGLFESGVTQISGSEIHFTINPTPNGNTAFQFFANSVDGFTFEHIFTNNATETSTFNANLSLTCFKKDNDNDGVKDELDLDSDNDGIPDFIERSGAIISLIGDLNNDGLDDAFDINFPPIDTDGDGVLDFYDLDSDNDGIYDLIETGQLGTLSDTNLDGVEDGPNFGVNGWVDAAETMPDSNIIGYTLNDFDGDTFFSYIDSDSDEDTCSDVIEAGFSDDDEDGRLGNIAVVIDANGLVTNAPDGYTLPDADYLNFSPISITTQPSNNISICLNDSGMISVISSEAETYQWEVSIDGGINWTLANDPTNYSDDTTSILTISNVPNSFNNYQYRAKLDRIGNSCGLYSNSTTLTVNPLPILNTPSNPYTQCDDDTNDRIASFNLELDWIKDVIYPNWTADGYVFTYYADQTQAETPGGTELADASNHLVDLTSAPFETIWIRATDTNDCFSVVPLNLEITPSSAALNTYSPTPLFLCDDDSADTGLFASFDLSGVRTEIETSVFTTIPVTVHFYESRLNAELEISEIADISNSIFRNTDATGQQSIWVRVKSNLGNDCLGLEELTNLLNVEALPIANQILFGEICSTEMIGSEPAYRFDTSSLEADILNGQAPNNHTIEYFFYDNTAPNARIALTYADGTPVISPIEPEFFTTTQTIIVRVTRNTTQSLDGPCFNEVTLNFVVHQEPIIANQILPIVECDKPHPDDNDDSNGRYPIDTSTFASTILGNQNMNIYFDYIDENGISQTDQSNLPNPLITESQTINVRVVNPNNPNCSVPTFIFLIVHELPEFTLQDEALFCGDPFDPTDITPIVTTTSDTYTYQWTFQDGSPAGTDVTLLRDDISLQGPGEYTLNIQNNRTTCSRSKTIDIKTADPPSITIDDLDINDFQTSNTVSIKDPTIIGNSIYEFSLIDEDGNIEFPYQQETIFRDVPPGIYTLLVQDIEEVCPVVSIPFTVLGYPKFFTPNGDTYNPVWKITGVNDLFQRGSRILIFDRYGKLLKQINTSEDGWDGTFKGSPMPTDDYWFKFIRDDGRVHTGHFTLKR